MFAAPITDLRQALLKGSLESLNPFPWAFMTGNCLGWVVYAYYTRDPFVLAANLPGLISSVWLNISAAKLQYIERMRHFKPVRPGEEQQQLQQQQQHHQGNLLRHSSSSDNDDLTGRPILERQPASTSATGHTTISSSSSSSSSSGGSGVVSNNNHWDASPPMDIEGEEAADLLHHGSSNAKEEKGYLILVPQERLLLRVLIVWSFVIVFVGWFSTTRVPPATTVGLIVNLNLVVFYAAPLESMQTVIRSKRSDSIHTPTMIMNWINTSFWILYGAFVRHDIMILLPNIIGLTLGLLQGLLCLLYPRSSRLEELSEPLAVEGDGLIVAEGDNHDDSASFAANDNNDEASDERFSIA